MLIDLQLLTFHVNITAKGSHFKDDCLRKKATIWWPLTGKHITRTIILTDLRIAFFFLLLQTDMLVFSSLIDNHEEGVGAGWKGAHNRCLSVNKVSSLGWGGLFLYLAFTLWLPSWYFPKACDRSIKKKNRTSHILFNHIQSYVPSFQWYLNMHDTLVQPLEIILVPNN